MKQAVVLFGFVLLAGCGLMEPPPAPVSNACGWLGVIHPDIGFEKRWTPAEIRETDALDNKIAQHCPNLAPPAAPAN